MISRAITGAVFTLIVFAIPGRGADDALRQIPCNQEWRFLRIDGAEPPQATLAAKAFDDRDWTAVSLPHTPRIETPESSDHPFLGVCWYRRNILARPEWRGRRVVLTFDGGMQVADVWVNGAHRLTHQGGYLPFSVDVPEDLARRPDVTVAVRLDNRANALVPPGKASVDFCYFGGLYRDAFLTVTGPVHITDAIDANQVAGGGIFARYSNVSAQSADVWVQAGVKNDDTVPHAAAVQFTLADPSGAVVAKASAGSIQLAPGEERAFLQTLHVSNPALWSPERPARYTLASAVAADGKAGDAVTTRIGIRSVAFNNQGFFLNGKPYVLRGANRHQDYPYIGNAESDNISYRDIKLLREAGYNFLRLCHYPQSPAVMDACDALGMMVSVCTPGWQYFNRASEFQASALRDVREMVRWHRNHPSAIMWEVTLNETYGHDGFYAQCAQAAHEEYPGAQMLTSGDTYDSSHAGYLDLPYPVWIGLGKGDGGGCIANPTARWTKAFKREYGDYEFGGQNSTSRVMCGEGEEKLLRQAWNHQWSHNQNLGAKWFGGDCLWAGIDDASSFSNARRPISAWGPLSYCRLRKFSYYFYQSQRDPSFHTAAFESGPMVHIASYWTPRSSPARLVVYSNCQEVALYLNGTLLERRKPDSGPDSGYGAGRLDAEKTAAKTGAPEKAAGNRQLAMFDGGNCRNLDHPPFTFPNLTYAPGELKAVGVLDGKPVAQDICRTPGKPAKLCLEISDAGVPLAADGADAIFVRAKVCDASGTVIPDAVIPVRFTVSGSARLLSPAAVPAEGGIASALIQATTSPGDIAISATADGFPVPAEIHYASHVP